MKFVFCEGGDDLAVITGVAQSLGLNDLAIEPFQGKDNLRNFLKAFKTRPEFTRGAIEALAIIRDADENGEAALQSVRDALTANGFNTPLANGTFVASEIKTGILVIGPNAGRGMIEDLCLNAVADRPEFHCVDDYFDCIAEKSARKKFSSKAKVRVWMASHGDQELYVGKAAEMGYWPWQSPVFDEMKHFLQQL